MIVDIAFLLTELLVILQYMNPVAELFPSYIQIAVFLLWLIAVSLNKSLFRKCIKTSLISAAVFLVTLIRCLAAEKIDMSYFSPMQSVIGRYQFFVYPTMFTYVLHLKKRKKQKLFYLAVISMLVTVVLSLYYIIKVDPQAIRNTQGVSYFGVGDFQLMYALALFSGPYLSYIREKKAKREKCWFHVISLSLICVCVLLCNLVTSVVILVISIALSYFFSTNKSYLRLFLIVLAGLAASLKNVWANILRNIAGRGIFYWSTNNKIIAIANLLSGTGGNLDTLSLRLQLTNISLNSFKKHPLFGINFKNHVSGMIGGHAQWVDDLARFGIAGNLIIWFNYAHIARYTIKCSSSFGMKSSMAVTWSTFAILGFLNPCLSGTILMAMFIVIPCMYGAQMEGCL